MTSLKNEKKIASENDEFDINRFIGEIIDHKKLIIAFTTGFTLIAILYAVLARPIYQANALLQIEQKQGNVLLNSLSQMLPDSQPQSAPEIALLQSRMILGKTVDDLNLQAKVRREFFPLIGEGLARINGKEFGTIAISYIKYNNDDDKIPKIKITIINKEQYKLEVADRVFKGKVNDLLNTGDFDIVISSLKGTPGSVYNVTYTPHLKAIGMLQNALTVADQGKDTGILNLTLLGDDPKQTSIILQTIVENYISQNIARQAAQDEKSLEFLNKQLPIVRNDLDIAEDKLNSYRKMKDSVDLSMEAKSVLDQIVNVDNQLNELTFREAEISQLYTKEHPTYKALLEKRNTLQEEKNKLNKKVSSMPSTQQEVLRLSRDVESGRAVYLQLLNRQQELNIAKSSAIGNARIIDNAVTDPKPVKPKKILIVLFGFVLGFGFSVFFVLLRVFMHRGIESPEELEEIGVTVYASIPVSQWLMKKTNKKNNESNVLLATDNPADLAIEAIRGLRTSLHFAMMESKNNILMISGASPSAGKTFISSNLASVIASTGKKILFIDADMRRGYVHKLFNVTSEVGLSNILSGGSSIEQAIFHIENSGFDFIPRGIAPPNPAELLMSDKLEYVLKTVSEKYDLIIIDTPPILAVTDAAIIGRYAGTSLLVARFEENTAKEIAVSIKKFIQSGVNIKGCILNGIVKKASSRYGEGYNYYSYSYKGKD
ncbi:polysaccharide biosynthesis tyrosine autokinase [Klebsiella africana]|uniref:polysaccharide biosynthesis tyrosine autokinase n=1 Tax=Klebsiella africana TaxID=2489010 RepID=UPI001933D59F|nr:polysaccharide biosynthesis tyrosine autokinase [Klebsiella africana]QRF14176.1 polysaccharide biosynthesis tyrosine autokinase [Klebsiella africana]